MLDDPRSRNPSHDPLPQARPRRAAAWRALAVAAIAVLLVAVAWLVWSRQIVHTVLTATEPAFATFVEGRDWADPATQSDARARMACSGRRMALRWLDASGIRQGASRWTALACAARDNDVRMAALLLRMGDPIDGLGAAMAPLGPTPPDASSGLQAMSPLAHAVGQGHIEMAEWLIARGGRPDASEDDQPTALQVASHTHCLPCLALLKRHGADFLRPSPALPLVMWIDGAPGGSPLDEAMLLQLARFGMAPNAIGTDGRSALHAAAAVGNPIAVNWLLSRGGNPVAADARGMTPLMHAVHRSGSVSPMAGARGEAVAALIAVTPRLTGRVRPDLHGPSLPTGPTPAVPEAGWSLAHVALRDPAFRQATAGHPIDYTGAPWATTPPATAREIVSAMSDDELRTTLGSVPPAADTTAQLPVVAARQGWVAEFGRAVALGLLDRERLDPIRTCALLLAAAEGAEDVSPQREASWRILVTMLDAGLRPASCGKSTPQEFQLRDAVAGRSPVQSVQWPARIAAP